MAPDNTGPEPHSAEELTGSEALDEDELRVDPLEGGIEPPEHRSGTDKRGTTPFEQRHGQNLDHRLAEEEPDSPLRSVDDEPAADVRRSGLPADEEEPADDTPAARRGQEADTAGGSVADAIRAPVHSDHTPVGEEGTQR